MPNTINDLKNQLKAMLEKTEDKEGIEQIGALNSLVDKIEAEHTKLQNENKDLIKDYKELIKHTSFQPNGNETQEVPETKEISFGDFLSTYKKDNN